MIESLVRIPDEVQLQIADNDGMLDKREEIGIEIKPGINYEIYQLDVADWEGMSSSRSQENIGSSNGVV